MGGLTHTQRTEVDDTALSEGPSGVEAPARALPEGGYDAQAEALSPKGQGGFDAQSEALTPEAAEKARSKRLKGEAKASAGIDVTPEALVELVKDWNGEIDTWERELSRHAHRIMGASAPNRISLGLSLNLGGALEAEKKRGQEGGVTPKLGATLKAQGEVGWGIGSKDILQVAELGEDALTFERPYTLGAESGKGSIGVFADLFVGAKVEGEIELEAFEGARAALDKLLSLLGAGAGEAAKSQASDAVSDVKKDAEGGSEPMPKVARDKEKSEGGGQTLASATAKGKAFVGAELTVGAKGALSWDKKEAAAYGSALEHYAVIALAFNPVSAPFAVPTAALLASQPDLMASLAPTLMGAGGATHLLTAEASLTGTAGAGAEGEASLGYKDGKLKFTADGKATVGFGGGGKVAVAAVPVELLRFGAAVAGGAGTELTGYLQGQIEALAERGEALWDSLVGWLAGNLSALGELLSSAGAEASALLLAMWDGLIEAGATAKDLVTQLWANAKAGIGAVVEVMEKASTEAMDLLWSLWAVGTDGITHLWSLANSLGDEVVDAFLDKLWTQSWKTIGQVWGSPTGASWHEALFDYVRGKGWDEIGRLAKHASGYLGSLFEMLWEKASMSRIGEALETAGDAFGAMLRHVWNASSYEQLGRMLDSMSSSAVVDAIESLWEYASCSQLGKLVAEVSTRVWDVLNTLWDLADLDQVVRILDAARDAGVEAAESLEKFAKDKLGVFGGLV